MPVQQSGHISHTAWLIKLAYKIGEINMELNQFITESPIQAKLIRAVVRQSGGWDSFKDMAEDITNHGVDGGFHGWIYYADTVPFAQRNKAVIMAMAQELANDLGEEVASSYCDIKEGE